MNTAGGYVAAVVPPAPWYSQMRIRFKSPGGGGWFALHVSECVSKVAEADPILSSP